MLDPHLISWSQPCGPEESSSTPKASNFATLHLPNAFGAGVHPVHTTTAHRKWYIAIFCPYFLPKITIKWRLCPWFSATLRCSPLLSDLPWLWIPLAIKCYQPRPVKQRRLEELSKPCEGFMQLGHPDTLDFTIPVKRHETMRRLRKAWKRYRSWRLFHVISQVKTHVMKPYIFPISGKRTNSLRTGKSPSLRTKSAIFMCNFRWQIVK